MLRACDERTVRDIKSSTYCILVNFECPGRVGILEIGASFSVKDEDGYTWSLRSMGDCGDNTYIRYGYARLSN